MLVNFVIGGTQKGGTSALDSFLRQHPEICLPETKKELHYFDREKNFEKRPNYKQYHAYFRPKPRHRVMGEATPSYMYWTATPYRIWRYNPEMKWILVLRNPVERAFSGWNMETKRGTEHLSFKEAVEQEAVRCRKALPLQHRVFSYVDRGFYAHQVRRLFNIFGEGNLLILLTEDLRTTGGKPVCPDRRDAYLSGIEAETSLIVRELTRKPEGSIERFSSRSPETLARFRHSYQGRDPDWHAASPHAAFSTPVEMTG